MVISRYYVYLADQRIMTTATSKQAATNNVLNYLYAPPSAVIKVTKGKTIS